VKAIRNEPSRSAARVLDLALTDLAWGRSALTALLCSDPLLTEREIAELHQLPKDSVPSIAGELLSSVLVFDRTSAGTLVFLQVARLVEQLSLGRVLTCPACGQLFVKRYRREYCSTRCQDRTDKRERRAGIRKARGARRRPRPAPRASARLAP
jgi:hypothetical protein